MGYIKPIGIKTFFYSLLKLFLGFFIFIFSWLEVEGKPYNFFLLDGRAYTYQDLSSHPKVVFMFWTSWCHYCQEKLEEINHNFPPHPDIQIFFINLGEKEPTVARFVKERNFKPFIKDNIVLDKKSVLGEKFGIIGIPFFVFLKKGKVVYQGYEFNDSLLKKFFLR